jgi:hypothetical protein
VAAQRPEEGPCRDDEPEHIDGIDAREAGHPEVAAANAYASIGAEIVVRQDEPGQDKKERDADEAGLKARVHQTARLREETGWKELRVMVEDDQEGGQKA